MSSLMTFTGRADTSRTAALPRRDPAPTPVQNLARRNEIFRALRDGGNAMFSTPLSIREIAAIFGLSERTISAGVASARALRRAVAEVTADD